MGRFEFGGVEVVRDEQKLLLAYPPLSLKLDSIVMSRVLFQLERVIKAACAMCGWYGQSVVGRRINWRPGDRRSALLALASLAGVGVGGWGDTHLHTLAGAYSGEPCMTLACLHWF